MPVDLNRLTEGWLELESDPGLFTLLLEDFGVKGIQVEEIYDLQKPFEGPVYGFIFLFKWISERRSRRKILVSEEKFVENEDIINSMFFAQQIVPNSCATHALLSVLLNCSNIHLGSTLARLKEYSKNMSPENKGYAIGNTPELAKAHNSHAKPQARQYQEKTHNVTSGRIREAFHFVSYVPVNGHLFELDGLKPYPNDHGPWPEGEDWTEKFRSVITERLGMATGGEPYHDIRFNLMAVVPDKRIGYEQKLRTLKTNRQIVLEALQQLVKLTHPEITLADKEACLAAMEKEMKDKKKKTTSSTDSTKSGASSSSLENMPTLSTPVKQPAYHSGEFQGSGTDGGTNSSSPYPKLPPALDSHNYAKSPLMEKPIGEAAIRSKLNPRYEEYSGSDYSDDNSIASRAKRLETALAEKELTAVTKPLSVNTELLKPLSIQTQFHASPTPSSSSTDTSSEAGSAFNSPIRPAPTFTLTASPGGNANNNSAAEAALMEDVKDIKKFLVIRVTSNILETATPKTNEGEKKVEEVEKAVVDDKEQVPSTENLETTSKETASTKPNEIRSVKRSASSDSISSTSTNDAKRICLDDLSSDSNTSGGQEVSRITSHVDLRKEKPSASSQLTSLKKRQKDGSEILEPHKFAPKDLLALLKAVEGEISLCETNLRDEIEKQKKYRVDDCRRTHNYDDFIRTFLYMLAEQGELTELVEQQLIVRRRQGIRVGRLHNRSVKSASTAKASIAVTSLPQSTGERKRSRPRPKRRR